MKPFYTNVERRGNKILHRFVDENGLRQKEEVSYKPRFYIETSTSQPDSKSMFGKPLEAVRFDDISSATEFLEKYRDVDGFKIFGQRDIPFQYITDTYEGEVTFDPTLIHVGMIDIEVFSGDIDSQGQPLPGPFPEPDEALYPVNAITFYHANEKRFYTWGLEVFNGKTLGTWVHDKTHPKIGELDIVYQGFSNERDLLINFLCWFESKSFDLITGWNSIGFDIPYLVNRLNTLLGPNSIKRLSPWGSIRKRTFKDGWKETNTYDFSGVSHLDYMDVFKKHAFIQPDDWKLGTVAEKVLSETKLSYAEAGSLNTLYVTNYSKLITYNIIDVDLLRKIDDKLQLIGVCLTLAYLMKANHEDALGTVKPWSARLYNDLNSRGMQPEIKGLFNGDTTFSGGFVMVPVPGRYRWVVSADLNSEYPHIMQQYNLGPETIIEPFDLPDEVRAIPYFTVDDILHKRMDLSVLKKYDLAMTANRQFFKRKDMSILNAKTREIYAARKIVKKEMLALEQQKVLIKEELARRGIMME